MSINEKLRSEQNDELFTAILTLEKIVEETGASTATISRVKRCLVYGADGYTLALDRLGAK